MDHERAVPLVSDWARGRLAADRAREVETHVRACAVCQDAAGAAAQLVAEERRLEQAAIAHPSSDALARYVETPEAEPVAALARVGAHVRGCERCGEDVAVMREAAAPAWLRAVRAWLVAPAMESRLLKPALAIAAVLLAYPAWLGVVELPRERASAERRLRDAEARARIESEARVRAALPAPASRGGGVAALVLRGPSRSGDSRPLLVLRPGQPFQPVLLDVAPPQGRIGIRMIREPEQIVWSAEGPRGDFWDQTNRLVGLLVPADALGPGDYRIEARSGAAAAPFFVGRFRIAASR